MTRISRPIAPPLSVPWKQACQATTMNVSGRDHTTGQWLSERKGIMNRICLLPVLGLLSVVSVLPTVPPVPAHAGAAPHVTVPGAPNCSIFPSSNVWNRAVTSLPVAPNSAKIVKSIGADIGLHPDFGSYAGYGIPYNVVDSSTPMVKVKFSYASESDRGPYPIPAHPKIEGGSDRHILIVDRSNCYLYELWDAHHASSGWNAGSGAIWNLESNHLRPPGWTSADAAGLPILPGLVRYDEVQRGVINHALRFTVPVTRRAYVYPARHEAGSTNNSAYPPMGLRLRLKASVDISGFSPEDQTLLQAMKTYGIIVADNGSPWYISGASDPQWNDDDLHRLDQITGNDFVVVDTTHFRNG